MGNYRPFLQGPLPVANYTRIIIPGRFWTRPPSTKSTRMASSATPLHDSLIELAIPDAHAHAIKWYLKPIILTLVNNRSPKPKPLELVNNRSPKPKPFVNNRLPKPNPPPPPPAIVSRASPSCVGGAGARDYPRYYNIVSLAVYRSVIITPRACARGKAIGLYVCCCRCRRRHENRQISSSRRLCVL